MNRIAMIVVGLLAATLSTPAKADDLFHWCGGKGLSEACVDWKPVRFNTGVVKVRIDPKLEHRQEIKQYVIQQANNNFTEVKFLFDGYVAPTSRYRGIYITVSSEYPTDAFTKWSKTKDRGSYAEAILVRCNLHPSLAKKNVTSEQLTKLLVVSFHETLHALGLGHDSDEHSLMHAGYDPSRVLTAHNIDVVNNLYSGVGIDLAEVQPYVEDGREVVLY